MRKILSLFMVLALFLHGSGTLPHAYAASKHGGQTPCLAPVLMHSIQGSKLPSNVRMVMELVERIGKSRGICVPSALSLEKDVQLFEKVSPASIQALLFLVYQGKLCWLERIRSQRNTSPEIKKLIAGLVYQNYGQYEQYKRKSPDMLIRKYGVRSLGKLAAGGKRGEGVQSSLIAALEDSDSFVRQTAVHFLVKIGPAAIPALLKVLERLHPEYATAVVGRALRFVKRMAIHAVPGILPTGTLPNDQTSKQSRPEVHGALLRTLGGLGAKLSPEYWRDFGARLINVFVHSLENKHRGVRQEAAMALGKTARKIVHAEKVVHALVKVLGDEDPAVREAAADALGLLGSQAAAVKLAIPALEKVLHDEEESVGEAAAKALVKLGAIQTLQEVLDNNSERARRAVLVAFRKLTICQQYYSKDLVALVVKVLNDSTLQMAFLKSRRMALSRRHEVAEDGVLEQLRIRRAILRDSMSACCWVLGDMVSKLGLSQEQLDPVIHTLFSAGRYGAIQVLARIGSKALPFLLQKLKSGELSEQLRAAQVLQLMGKNAFGDKEVVVLLLEILSSGDDRLREIAAEALEQILPSEGVDENILEELSRVFLNGDLVAANAVGKVLAHLGSASVPFLRRALDQGLTQKDKHLCRRVVRVLGLIGVHPQCCHKGIVLELFRALDSWHDEIRREAENSFERMGIRAVPALLEYLGHEYWGIRWLAVKALQAIGKVAAEDPRVVAGLIGAFRDEDHRVKQIAAETLVELQCPIEDETVMLAVYVVVLETGSRSSREKAALVLGDMIVRPGNKKQLKAVLNRVLADSDYHVRWRAVFALSKLANALADSQYVLTKLLEALQDDDSCVRREAIDSLSKNMCLFEDKTPVVAALKRLIEKEKVTYVKNGALHELREIESESPEMWGLIQSRAKRSFHSIDFVFADQQNRAVQLLSTQNLGEVSIAWIDESLAVGTEPRESTDDGLHCRLVYDGSQYKLVVQQLPKDNTEELAAAVVLAENLADLRCTEICLVVKGEESWISPQYQYWRFSLAGVQRLLVLVSKEEAADREALEAEGHQLDLNDRRCCNTSA